jgi:hypothetical protein
MWSRQSQGCGASHYAPRGPGVCSAPNTGAAMLKSASALSAVETCARDGSFGDAMGRALEIMELRVQLTSPGGPAVRILKQGVMQSYCESGLAPTSWIRNRSHIDYQPASRAIPARRPRLMTYAQGDRNEQGSSERPR